MITTRADSSKSESDPTGRAPHDMGAKLDSGKTKMGLILLDMPRALEAIGQIATFGAQKYAEHSWLEVPNGAARYTDALIRHLLKEGMGEVYDPDSGLYHAAHLGWNALARLELMMRRKEVIKSN